MGLFDFLGGKKEPELTEQEKQEKEYYQKRIELSKATAWAIDRLLIPFIESDKSLTEFEKQQILMGDYVFYKLVINDNNTEKVRAKIIDYHRRLLQLYIDNFYNETISNLEWFKEPYELSDKIFEYNHSVFTRVFHHEHTDMLHIITKGRRTLWERHLHIPYAARQAHTYIIGASKSGKSELIKYLIDCDFSSKEKCIILLEPHGDLSEQVAKLYRKNDERLVYIDFTLDPNQTPILNLFDIEDRSTQNIENQSQAIIDAFEDILGTDFSTQMEELLGATIRTLMYKGDCSFWDLRRFMDDTTNADLVEVGKKSPNPKDRIFFTDGTFLQENYKATKRSIKAKIGTYLGYSTFRNFTTGKSTINLKYITDNHMYLICNLSKGDIGKKVSPIIGRFFIAALQNTILQRSKTDYRPPVFLYIDEFQNYTSDTIEEVFSESRKYGFYLTVAHQNLGQLGAKLRESVMSNTSVKIVGKNHSDQLDKLSKDLKLDFEELDKLTTGHFAIRVDKAVPYTFKLKTDLLGNNGALNDFVWNGVKRTQLEKYYRPIERYEDPQTKPNQNNNPDNFDFNPSDSV